MTRKEALIKAIAYLKELDEPSLNDVITELESLAQCIPITEWDETTIFDAIEQFHLDQGRYPFSNEFCGYRLPSHSVIRRKFQMYPTELIERYYPDEREAWHNSLRRYCNQPTSYWLQQFQETIKRNPGVTSRNYDRYRMPDTPCLMSLFKIMQVETWNELLVLADLPVKKYNRCSRIEPVAHHDELVVDRLFITGENGTKMESWKMTLEQLSKVENHCQR